MALNEFITLDPNIYLSLSEDNFYSVDVAALSEATIDFIEKHYQDYVLLIENYKKLFDEEKTK